MINLILKDILIQKKTLWFAALYSIFVFFAFSAPMFSQGLYIMGAVAISYIFILTAVAYDDKNNSDVILNSLPLKRSSIIMAKYLSIIVFVALSVGIVGIIGMAIRTFGILPISPRLISITDFLGTLISIGILCSLYLPLYYKFGSIRVRIFNIFLFLAVFFIPSYLGEMAAKNQPNEFVLGILTGLKNFPDWLIWLVSSAFTLVTMLISMFISIQIYKRKDF